MRPIVKYTVEVLCGHLSAKTAESIMMPFGLIIIIINDNVYGAVLMTMVTARVHPVHLMNAD